MLAHALAYAARQWSIIPLIPQDKRPLLTEWKKWQQQRATTRQIEAWVRTWPTANLGIITGTISNLVVVDLDGDEGLAQAGKFPETAKVKTAHGLHLYYRHPGGLIANRVRLLPGVDIRGDAGYVAAPPSIHATGVVYTWIKPECPLAGLPVLPAWVVESSRELKDKQASEPLPAGPAGNVASESGSASPCLASPIFQDPVAAQVLREWLDTATPGKKWFGRCPAHDDRSPSLRVFILPDGRPWLKCFGPGRPRWAILRALGFEYELL